MIRLSWLGTYVQTSHDDHDDVVDRGEIDIVHDQELTITETRLGVDLGLPRGFGATLVLPVRLVSTSIRYLDDAGAEVELTRPGIHHRTETLTGLGDPMVLGSWGRAVGEWRLSGRAGLTFPLGRTENDPFAMEDEAHEHIQMGTGTVNPVIAAEVTRTLGAWRLGGFALTQQIVYANGKGYQGGDRYAGGVSVSRRLGARWNLRGGGQVQVEAAERWGGIVHTDDGNRGRIDAMLTAGGSWSAGRGISLDLGVQVPVVTHVVGGQLDMPAILELGASWSFGGAAAKAKAKPEDEDDHDHDHDHEDHADHEDHEDHEDHADHEDQDDHAHEAVDLEALVPEPGKLTIFDVWATWCEACKVLEPALDALVAAHPEIVLRRIDASEWEDFTVPLPHVRIFDAGGVEVYARSSDGDIEKMIEAIRAIVEPPPRKNARKKQPKPRTYAILVTEAGFEPGNITVPVGKPVILRFERRTDKTCATEVVMEVGGERIEQALPLDQPITLALTFPTAGTITYACAMDMIRGTITVK